MNDLIDSSTLAFFIIEDLIIGLNCYFMPTDRTVVIDFVNVIMARTSMMGGQGIGRGYIEMRRSTWDFEPKKPPVPL